VIESALSTLPDVHVLLFEPAGAPAPERMKVRTETPKMTRARALLLRLFESYRIPGYRLSLLEIQKLAYFLQAGGEPLRLNFIKLHSPGVVRRRLRGGGDRPPAPHCASTRPERP
jgi:hypothetical protein